MKPTLIIRERQESTEPDTPQEDLLEDQQAPADSEAPPPPQPKARVDLRTHTRVLEIDPLHLERERILPPGAAGAHGRPYKMLRTQVLRRLDKLAVNSLAVVGAAADTGKTLTAVNLAIAIAADPERTALLIDLDLRKPSIHRRFGIEPEVGIDDCLRRVRPLSDAMVRFVSYERLVALPARRYRWKHRGGHFGIPRIWSGR